MRAQAKQAYNAARLAAEEAAMFAAEKAAKREAELAKVDSRRKAYLSLIGYAVDHDAESRRFELEVLTELEEKKKCDAPEVDEWWFIGDNLELLKRTNLMSKNKRNLLYHFFNVIASKLRVSSLFLPDNVALGDMRRHWKFLDNVVNKEWMVDHFETVVMLMKKDIVLRLDFMKAGAKFDCSEFVPTTREHKYTKTGEMDRESQEVHFSS